MALLSIDLYVQPFPRWSQAPLHLMDFSGCKFHQASLLLVEYLLCQCMTMEINGQLFKLQLATIQTNTVLVSSFEHLNKGLVMLLDCRTTNYNIICYVCYSENVFVNLSSLDLLNLYLPKGVCVECVQ